MMGKHRVDLAPALHPVLGVAFLNFIFVFLLLVIFFSFFASPSGFEVRMPVSSAGHGLEENHVTVRITGENVLYFDDRVVTINDLKRAFRKINAANTVIYVRVDRRASMGRVADVWDLCKGLGLARVNVVASQDN